MKQVYIDGRIGKDAEVVTSTNGNKYVRFSVAVNTFKNGEEKTEWFDINSYDPFIVDSWAKYLVKGRYVIVAGELETSVSAKDGKVWLNQRVKANMIDAPKLGNKKDDEQGQAPVAEIKVQEPEPATVNVSSLSTSTNSDESDLPF